jgi:CheY-like chemotaxis protein
MHILIVDDAPSVLKMTRKILHSAGYEVTCVGSGAEAIESVSGHEFDLVLMDVVMETMSGMVAARAIRLSHPLLPIVFMTGFPDQLDALHNETVLEKPFTVEKLLGMVERVMKKQAAAQG